MSLADKLKETKANSANRIPADVRAVMKQASQALAGSGIGSATPKVGEQFPDFNLKNHLFQARKLTDYIATGPAIITFYRGGWCPYCNLELKAYQAYLSEIKELGASIVAISPELPDASLTTHEKNELKFDVLSDSNSEFAQQLGLAFRLDDRLKPIYDDFGIDLQALNGNDSLLPLPSTFLVNKEATIVSAHVDTDHTQRQEPSDLVALIKSI